MARKNKNASERVSERRLFNPEKTRFLDRALSVEEQITELELALPKAAESDNEELSRLKAELVDIEEEWDDRKWNPSFKRALRRYRKHDRRTEKREGGVLEDAVETVYGDTIESLTALQDEIDKFLDRDSVSLASQSLVDRGLTAADLVGGEKQALAVETFFASRPDIADFILALSPEKRTNILNKLESTVKKAIEARESARAGHEQVEKEVVMGATESKIRELAGEAADNPGKVLIGLIAGIGILAIANHYKDKLGFLGGPVSFISKVGMAGGAAAGLVVGANWIHRKFSEDETGFLDDVSLRSVMLDKEQYDSEHFSSKYREMLEGLTEGNREAINDLLKLGETDCTDVAASFEDALRDPAKDRRVDTRYFTGKARQINGRRAYQALESVMSLCADEAGISIRENKDQRLHKGLQEFRRKYGAEYTLSTAIMHLVGNREFPRSLEESATSGALSFRRLLGRPPAGPEEEKKASKVVELFNTISGIDMPVEARGVIGKTSKLAIKGYVFDYTFDSDADMHKFVDPSNGHTIAIPLEGDNSITLARGLESYIDGRMKDRFIAETGAVLGSRKIVFDRTSNEYWSIEPPFVCDEIDHIDARAAAAVPVRVYSDETKSKLSVYIDGMNDPKSGEPKRFLNWQEGREAYQKEVVLPKIIRKDLANYIGELPFIVEDIAATTSHTTLVINYGKSLETPGNVEYANEKISRVALKDNPELDRAHQEIAAKRASKWRSMVEGGPAATHLASAFEGHWKGKWWENFSTIPFGRSLEAMEAYWGEDDHLGRSITHNREKWWQEVRADFKLEEYEYTLEQQIFEVLSSEKDPAKAQAKIEQLEKAMEATVSSDFDALAVNIDTKLSGTHEEIDRGRVLEETLHSSMETLDTMGYMNSPFITFSNNIEKMMNNAGFDYEGTDGWRRAKRVRESVRRAAYRYAWPIPTMSDAKFAKNASTYQTYLDDLEGQIRWALKAAQLDSAGNIDYIVIEDRRIDAVSFEDAIKASGFDKFSERPDYVSAVAGAYSTSATATSSPSLSAGVSGSMSLNAQEIIELEDEGVKKLNKIYDDIDDIEWNATFWNSDDFDVVFNEFRRQRVQAFGDDLAGLTNSSDIEAVINRHEMIAVETRRKFLGWTSGPANQETFMADARDLMLETMTAGDPSWDVESRNVAGLLLGENGFDKYFVCEDAIVFMDIMNLWTKSVDTGAVSAIPGATPEEYRNYFLHYVQNLAGTAAGSDKNLSWDEWKTVRASVRTIKSFKTWSAATTLETHAVLPGLDLAAQIADAGIEKKKQSKESFREWYKEELRITDYFVFNRDWQNAYENSIEKRLVSIESNPAYANPADFEQALKDFRAVLAAEKNIYNELKLRGIDTSDFKPDGAQTMLDQVVYPAFNSVFGTTPTVTATNIPTYIARLESNLETATNHLSMEAFDKELKSYLRGKRIKMIDTQNLLTNPLDSFMWQSLFADSATARFALVKGQWTPGTSSADKQTDYDEFIRFLDAESEIWANYISSGTSKDNGWYDLTGIKIDDILNTLNQTFDTYYIRSTTGRRNETAYKAELDKKMPKPTDIF